MSNSKAKTVEEKYQKKTPYEHIRIRPGMYIGSIQAETTKLWIFNEEAKEDDAKFLIKDITYVPGLYKIYDEIIVNAADHSVRCPGCNSIKVWIDKETGKITVWNNGDGIDVAIHKETKVYVPTMIFSHLYTSTNYDDNEERIVGGTNGYGAKLTNIFSSEFEIETVDATKQLKFYQKFSNNMLTTGNHSIEKCKLKPYTKISFIPDFKEFGIDGLTDDVIALFKKRVYDLAMTTKCKVYYNDELIGANTFAKYIDLYFPVNSSHKKAIEVSGRWKVGVVYDPTDQLDHQTISFVNSICTSRGGTHVDYVSSQIINILKKSVEKKLKEIQVKPAMIKENLLFFIDSVIDKPMFDTQTKETLKTKSNLFGSTYKPSETLLKNILKSGVIDSIVVNAQAKAEAGLSKATGKTRGAINYPKLYNAHKSGTKYGYKCALILTEGDSAKTFAMAGLNVIGRDYFGVFPLRGKLLNVRDENPIKIANNEEITAITKIIGLEHKKEYKDTKGLRYGKIIIMADQDVDGSHIKGLIINFIHYFWPSLVKLVDGFIQAFTTPLIKATKGTGKAKKTFEFTSSNAFDEWKDKNNGGKGWKIKYYKGLGTSDPKEARECFHDFDKKLVKYYWQSKLDLDEEEEPDDDSDPHVKQIPEDSDDEEQVYKPKMHDVSEDAVTLAFDEKRADDRKTLLECCDPSVYLDPDEKEVSYYDFFHKEMIQYSLANVRRSIPHIADNFKPSQRKVFYGCKMHEPNLYTNEIKVAQLGGYVAGKTAYHHGEASLFGTTIEMAQNFVGSNNINLLIPDGGFGSRLQGGKDASSERYIHTGLNPIVKKIFIADDDYVLTKQYEENKEIEPEYYCPIIPMVLVNGTKGIGTGWSTTIESCNPRDILVNLRRMLKGENPYIMVPWYRHFTGSITKVEGEKQKYICKAKYTKLDDDTLHITDLPIGVWTDNYKALLENLIQKGIEQKNADAKKKDEKPKRKKVGSKTTKSKTAKVSKKTTIGAEIKSYTEDCTDVRISFTITFHPGKLNKLIKSGKLEKELKLSVPLHTTNMHLFGFNGKIKRYNSYGDILREYVQGRLVLYQKRKDFLLKKWKSENKILEYKIKFIEGVAITGTIVMFKNKKISEKQEIIDRLEELEFPKLTVGNEVNPSYNYITSMSVLSLTKDELESLKKQYDEKKHQIDELEPKTPVMMWTKELDEFEEAYNEWEKEETANYAELLVYTPPKK